MSYVYQFCFFLGPIALSQALRLLDVGKVSLARLRIFLSFLCMFNTLCYKPYVYSRLYVYSFCQIFHALNVYSLSYVYFGFQSRYLRASSLAKAVHMYIRSTINTWLMFWNRKLGLVSSKMINLPFNIFLLKMHGKLTCKIQFKRLLHVQASLPETSAYVFCLSVWFEQVLSSVYSTTQDVRIWQQFGIKVLQCPKQRTVPNKHTGI